MDSLPLGSIVVAEAHARSLQVRLEWRWIVPSSATARNNFVRRGRQLEYFTIVYNSAEGLVSIVAGLIAGSVSLVGFGLDSMIEVTSGAALLWRPLHDLNHSRREQVERITLRMVGCPIPQRVAEELPAEHGLRLRIHDQPESCQNICQRGLHRFRTRRELLDRAPDSPRSPRTEYLRLPRTTSPESVRTNRRSQKQSLDQERARATVPAVRFF